MIEVPVDTLHTLPEFWGEDAEKFNPERFLDNPDLLKEFFYLPFGAGPRNCIGMRFALLQNRILIARLVKEFKLDLADGFSFEDFKPVRTLAFFLKAEKPIEIIFTRL